MKRAIDGKPGLVCVCVCVKCFPLSRSGETCGVWGTLLWTRQPSRSLVVAGCLLSKRFPVWGGTLEERELQTERKIHWPNPKLGFPSTLLP